MLSKLLSQILSPKTFSKCRTTFRTNVRTKFRTSLNATPNLKTDRRSVEIQNTCRSKQRVCGASAILMRHPISKPTQGRSKFQIRVGAYFSCLEPASLRSQLPSTSDFPISWSFALSLLFKFRSISNAIVYCSLKIKLTFLGISRKYFKDLFKKISSAAHGAKKIAL